MDLSKRVATLYEHRRLRRQALDEWHNAPEYRPLHVVMTEHMAGYKV